VADPLLILDLDETLIFSTRTELSRAPDFVCEPYLVYKRPFVQEFLAAVAQCYLLAVWTSSTDDYAACIVSELFGGMCLEFVWCRDRCTRRFDVEMQERYWLKNLKKLKRAGYDLERVLFVDNSAQALERNLGNLVLVPDFEGDPADRVLERLARYLADLSREPRFRGIDKRGWDAGP